MTCSSCGRELPGEFPFCPFCGAAVADAPPAVAARLAGADEQLAAALAFYRSVSASAYVAEAEALLAATA